MPKIFLNEKDRMSERLVSWVYGQMKSKRITQKQLAEELQITQPALSHKLKVRQFTYTDFVTIVGVFDPDLDDLAWLMGRKGSI